MRGDMMEEYEKDIRGERRDFLVLIVSIMLFSSIAIFIMKQFWWLTLRSIGILLFTLSIISFIPAVSKVRCYKRIAALLMSAGVLCGAAALFYILPSYILSK
jgi:hypothetical protein